MPRHQRLNALDAPFLGIETDVSHMDAGARMQTIHPLMPLLQNQALGIALFTYAGKLHWGIAGDWQRVPDPRNFIDDLKAAFAELRGELRGHVPAP